MAQAEKGTQLSANWVVLRQGLQAWQVQDDHGVRGERTCQVLG